MFPVQDDTDDCETSANKHKIVLKGKTLQFQTTLTQPTRTCQHSAAWRRVVPNVGQDGPTETGGKS